MDRQVKKAAERLDAEGVLALCRSSEEFLGVIDGEIMTYDQFAPYERAGFKSFQQHRLMFDTLLIHVLGVDTVAALAMFQQVLTDLNGKNIYLRGELPGLQTRERMEHGN